MLNMWPGIINVTDIRTGILQHGNERVEQLAYKIRRWSLSRSWRVADVQH